VPAVTSVAARALGVERRIGTVAAGRDADLVAFAGEPWEPSSQVLLVIVDGRVVFEEQRRR
jgi:imidazolonepropionase-like amidohydrolase